MASPSPANVRVLVRIRPLNQRELSSRGSVGRTNALSICDGNDGGSEAGYSNDAAATTIRVGCHGRSGHVADGGYSSGGGGVGGYCSDPSNAAHHHPGSSSFGGGKHFSFDAVLGPRSTQADVFDCTKSIVDACASGYNGTIIAYGMTGSGKTHTMFGGGGSAGLVQRSLRALFSGIAVNRASEVVLGAASAKKRRRTARDEYFDATECHDLEGRTVTTVHASFIEIYNEKVYDLLADDESKLENALPVREDARKEVYVEGLSEVKVSNTAEAEAVLGRGARNRHVAATAMNRTSSRSHAVFALRINTVHTTQSGLSKVRTSKFTLVDLAGSERQKATDTAGARLKEASMINQSLLRLGHVINALVDQEAGKGRHIHYRDSKLTFLLRDSLGGNSKTCLVATVSPSAASLEETLSTLKFAQRAKLIRNTAVLNEDTRGNVAALQAEVARLRSELQNSADHMPSRSSSNFAASSAIRPNPTLSSGPMPNPSPLLECSGGRVSFSDHMVTGGTPDLNVESLRRRAERAEERAASFEHRSLQDKQVLRTLKRKLDEEKLVRRFKESRIDYLTRRQRGGDEDEDVVVLCDEIDCLRRQLDAPNPETIKWKVAYERKQEELDLFCKNTGMKGLREINSAMLEAEIEKLANEKMALERRLSIASLQPQCQDSSGEDDAMKLRDEVRRLEAKLSAQEDKREDAVRKIKTTEVDVDRLKSELDEARDRMALAESDLAKEREESNQLAKEVERLMDEVDEKNAQIDSAQAETTAVKAELQTKLDALNEHVENTKTLSMDKQVTENELRERLAAVSKDNAILIRRVQGASTDIDRQGSEIDDLLQKISNLEKERDTAESNERERSNESRVYVSKLEKLEMECARLTKAAAYADGAAQKETRKYEQNEKQLRNRIHALEREHVAMKEEAGLWEERATEEKQIAQALRVELSDLSKAKDELEFEQETLQDDQDTLNEQVKFLIEKSCELEEENLRLRKAQCKSTDLNAESFGNISSSSPTPTKTDLSDCLYTPTTSPQTSTSMEGVAEANSALYSGSRHESHLSESVVLPADEVTTNSCQKTDDDAGDSFDESMFLPNLDDTPVVLVDNKDKVGRAGYSNNLANVGNHIQTPSSKSVAPFPVPKSNKTPCRGSALKTVSTPVIKGSVKKRVPLSACKGNSTPGDRVGTAKKIKFLLSGGKENGFPRKSAQKVLDHPSHKVMSSGLSNCF